MFETVFKYASDLVHDSDLVQNEPKQMLDISAFAELSSHEVLEEILGNLDQLDEKVKNFIAQLRSLLQQEVAEVYSQAHDLLINLATPASHKQQINQ